MTTVEKIKALKTNQFEGMSLGRVYYELDQLGIKPAQFNYNSNVIIRLGEYDDEGYWHEYHIDITDGICLWSELVTEVYDY